MTSTLHSQAAASHFIEMNKKSGPTHIDGEALARFVLHSALLWLIDPVRGEATRSIPDENPDGNLLSARYLKQKFLDSFALICSTSRSGANTATAVCLETYERGGNILRVARNKGLKPEDKAILEQVLRVLQEVARKEKRSSLAESDIMQLVVELDRDRIVSCAERVQKRGLRSFLQNAQPRMNEGRVSSNQFRLWLENCPFTGSPPQDWGKENLAMLIHWAAQARWHHAEQLETLLALEESRNNAWLNCLHKIARYYSAIKSMVKVAVKESEIFVNISIHEIAAPNPRLFKFPHDEAPLFTIIRKLVGQDAHSTMEQLKERLGMEDVEARLHRACRLKLTLHAEMQLVVFYEGNPEHAPRLRFIGTSKKACFLCNKYLSQHSLNLQVSACHQKIYPSWMPPPYYKTPGRSWSINFMKLGDAIETLTARELKTSLSAPRRLGNYDSTAGPSLTMSATVPTELRSLQVTQGGFTGENDDYSEDSD
ncbi:unnamed protein product [Fusarium langsethiae]|nr:unnamed protein product [Fusarium langsethiae]